MLDANLHKAPTINNKVFHSTCCKQSVAEALGLFDKTTAAILKCYFPKFIEAANLLSPFQNYRRSKFLPVLADWIEYWSSEQIANYKKFTLPTQSAKAFKITLRYHVAIRKIF